MQVENINHIHYFSEDFEKTKKLMEIILGREPNFFHDYTQEAGVIVSFWNFPHGFQVMGVSDKSKTWGQFGTDTGKKGMHTLSCQVKSIEECEPELKAMGWEILHDTMAASGGVREVTVDTHGDFNFYIELMEYVADFRE